MHIYIFRYIFTVIVSLGIFCCCVPHWLLLPFSCAEPLQLMSSCSSPWGCWKSYHLQMNTPCPVHCVEPLYLSAGRFTTPARGYRSSNPTACTGPSLQPGEKYVHSQHNQSCITDSCIQWAGCLIRFGMNHKHSLEKIMKTNKTQYNKIEHVSSGRILWTNDEFVPAYILLDKCISPFYHCIIAAKTAAPAKWRAITPRNLCHVWRTAASGS